MSIVGMWEKDKEIGNDVTERYSLDEAFGAESEYFVLWAASVDKETVSTEYGEARKTRLQVSDVGGVKEDAEEVTSLAGAIADKVMVAEASDFPAVVQLRRVKSKRSDKPALVLQYVSDYTPKSAAQNMSDLGTDEEAPVSAKRSK